MLMVCLSKFFTTHTTEKADALRQGLPHLTDPASLQGKKQRRANSLVKKGKRPGVKLDATSVARQR
jgi:hypothetical protein